MIKKLIFNAYHNPNIKTIIELSSGERIIVCEDKWELVNDLSFFKSVGKLINSRIGIKEELQIQLNYEDCKLNLYLFNKDEIDLKYVGPYHKLY